MLVGVVVVCPVRVWRLHCLGIKGDGEVRGRWWIDGMDMMGAKARVIFVGMEI